MLIAHVLRTTADRLRLEAHPYAREGMTPTQIRKYPTSRSWVGLSVSMPAHALDVFPPEAP